MPGKYSQVSMIHSQVLHPSAESTRRDRKKGVLVNTPTLTCVYTRAFIKEGEEELRNSTDIGIVSPVQRGAVYLKIEK
jgi:hypothetical protein